MGQPNATATASTPNRPSMSRNSAPFILRFTVYIFLYLCFCISAGVKHTCTIRASPFHSYPFSTFPSLGETFCTKRRFSALHVLTRTVYV